MIGVDILEISRMEKAFTARFAERVFSAEERDYLKSKNNAPSSIAGIFCAKEAIAKALGTGFAHGVCWSDVQILHDQNGCPVVKLCNEALNELLKKGKRMNVSISHTDTTAIAFASIEQ